MECKGQICSQPYASSSKLCFKIKNEKEKRKKIGGWTGIRTHALGTASAPNEALQTLTSQGQTPCLVATIFKKFLGRTIADTMLENYDPVF